jgi:CheY-like chemotaxis protein
MKRAHPGLILLADDDPDDRLLVKEALLECGAPPSLAGAMRSVADGEELLDYLLRQGRYTDPASSPRPDLVLLDLNMPRKDGREALREIRAHPSLRRLPVVVFTTSRADTDIALIYELGANSFVTKPVAFDALLHTLRQLAGYWLEVVELPGLADKVS